MPVGLCICRTRKGEWEEGERRQERKDGKVATPFNENSSFCSKVKQPVESPNTLYSKKEDGMESQNIQEMFKTAAESTVAKISKTKYISNKLERETKR